MSRVAIEYGPTGHRGVSDIMGIGALVDTAAVDTIFIPPDVETALSRAGWAAMAVFGLGVVADKPALRNAGLGGAAVAFGVRYLVPKR